jgi:hypothetical protein
MDNCDDCRQSFDQLHKDIYEGGLHHSSLPLLTAELDRINDRLDKLCDRTIILEGRDKQSEESRRDNEQKHIWGIILIIIILVSNIIYKNFIDIEYIRALLHL